jgi:hypothetical protein
MKCNYCKYVWKPASHNLSNGVVVHGDDKCEDEQLDEADESDSLRHGLVVRSDVGQGEVNRIVYCCRCLGKESHCRGVASVCRKAVK